MFELGGDHYLSSCETAKRLGISPGTLRNYRSDGRKHVPFKKLAGSVLYSARDVDAYLLERQA